MLLEILIYVGVFALGYAVRGACIDAEVRRRVRQAVAGDAHWPNEKDMDP